jgi:sulfate adenylyltransferase subunit 1 (EFTu-like GTPase family)
MVADIPVATKVATVDNSTHHLLNRVAATGLQVDNTAAANRAVCLLLDGIRAGIRAGNTIDLALIHFTSDMRLHWRRGTCYRSNIVPWDW